MKVFRYSAIAILVLATQSVHAHGWQAAAMWDWAINTANPKFADLDATDTALAAENASQQAEIDALQTQLDSMDAYIQQLQAYIEVDESATPVVRVVAANLQVVNGQSSTATTDGTGNLIVGYNQNFLGDPEACDDGAYGDQLSCETAGKIWGSSFRSGSHNLVVGDGHSYSQYGGIVAGAVNTINRPSASVLGGYFNLARGYNATVSGGARNIAAGNDSSVSGGEYNIAAGDKASVTGGGGSDVANGNIASGTHASISGGSNGEASGPVSSISGGAAGTASGIMSSVSGGRFNYAQGLGTAVSGGRDGSVSGDDDWRAGTLFEDN